MNRYPVKTVSIKITWKSGAKVKYTHHPLDDLSVLLSLYTPEMSQIRKITVKESTQPR